MDTEKSEITNLPKGMSSEELDALTMEDDNDDALAQKGLGAAEEKSSPAEESVTTEEEAEEKESVEKKEPEVDPKDAVIGDFRRKNRDLEVEKARLEGELQARKSMQTKAEKPLPKSPLEIAEAAYIEKNGSLDGFAMNGELYRQQKAFDDEQAAIKVAAKEQQQAGSALEQAAMILQEGDLSVDKMGEGLDLQSVLNMAETSGAFTRGDKLDLADIQAQRGTQAALKEAYEVAKRRIIAAGGQNARLLQSAMNTKSKSKTQTKPKKPTDIDALTTEGMGEAETDTQQEEVLSRRLTNFIFS